MTQSNISSAVVFLLLLTVHGVLSQELPDPSEPSEHKPTYDQRQTGKYNVNFNIKDVNIFTLEGDTVGGGIGDGDLAYEDYGDYDYDNSHYTIHPIFGTLGGTSKKPTTADVDVTEKPAQKPAATTVKASNTTTKPQTTTARPTSPHKPNAQLIYILRPNQTAETIALDYQDSDQIPVEIVHGRRVPLKRRNKPQRQNLRRPGHFRGKEGSIKYLTQNAGYRALERCQEGESRDRNGVCRARRANGIKRLLNFITSFTKHDDDDDN